MRSPFDKSENITQKWEGGGITLAKFGLNPLYSMEIPKTQELNSVHTGRQTEVFSHYIA